MSDDTTPGRPGRPAMNGCAMGLMLVMALDVAVREGLITAEQACAMLRSVPPDP